MPLKVWPRVSSQELAAAAVAAIARAVGISFLECALRVLSIRILSKESDTKVSCGCRGEVKEMCFGQECKRE